MMDIWIVIGGYMAYKLCKIYKSYKVYKIYNRRQPAWEWQVGAFAFCENRSE